MYKAVVKILESLSTQGKIMEKIYGKQKVYCALQVYKIY